jgi:predicted RNA-binding Zn ribbon-like protein
MDELDLALLEAFLNSHDNGARGEWFDPEHPEYFAEWAQGSAAPDGVQDGGEPFMREVAARYAALADAHPTVEEVRRVRAVRDGLMAMITEGDAAIAPDGLDTVLAELPLRLRVREGIDLEPAGVGPLAVAAAAVLAAYRIQVSGNWGRLRLCRSDDCHWAFFDRSKNRSRVWCAMSACGARSKSRAYRERQRTN